MPQLAGYAMKFEGVSWLHSRRPLAKQALRMPEMVDATLHDERRKACNSCGETKPASDFFSRKSQVSGNRRILFGRCKTCTLANAKIRRSSEGEKIRAQERASWRRRFHVNGHSKRVSGLDWRLRTVFGLTIEKFMEMLERQNNACAICKSPIQPVSEESQRAKSARVDHDHVTGKVRGLLCNYCNLAIGYLKDKPENADALAAYLRMNADVG